MTRYSSLMIPALDFADAFSAAGLATLLQVIFIDLTMAGDNVVIMGTLAGGLPERDRKRVIMLGVGMALGFLLVFAFLATALLKVTGLLLAGGLLLLWVAWKMWRELHPGATPEPVEGTTGPRPKTFLQAAIQIAVADLSMSLDNVLAVAGTARDHPTVLLFGLAFSVTIMGLAANLVARLVQKYHWIAYIGLAMILYVATKMIWEGWHDVAPHAARLMGA
jgi:YjbE family integral membrane protein